MAKASANKEQPKEEAAEPIVENAIGGLPEPPAEVEQEAPKAKGKFTVNKGKSFADANDINKTWNDGDDVSHFEPSRLDFLVEQGLVVKK